MKVLFLIAFISIGAFAQDTRKDLDLLRQKIGLPANSPILYDRDATPYFDSKVKTLAVIEGHGKSQRKFEKWVANRNSKPKNETKIELVNDIRSAEFLVVQIKRKRAKIEQERVLTIGNIDKSGAKLGDFKVSEGVETRVVRIPVFSYVLIKINGFWTIVFSDSESSVNGEQRVNPDTQIRAVVSRILKN